MPSDETKKTPRKTGGEKASVKKTAVKKESKSNKTTAKKSSDTASKTVSAQKKKIPPRAQKPAVQNMVKQADPAVEKSVQAQPEAAPKIAPKAAPAFNWKAHGKTITIVAAVFLAAIGGFAFYKLSSPTLFTYKDNAGKTIAVNVKEVLSEIQPILTQVTPQDMEGLQGNNDAVNNLANYISVRPRLFLLKALEISNFRESAEYLARISNDLQSVPLRIAFNKGIEEVNKVVEKETVNAADISRILFTRTGDAAADEKLLASAKETLAALKTSTNTNAVEEFGRAALEKSQDQVSAEMGGYVGTAYKGQIPDLDTVLFTDKAPEGLYAEVIEGSNSYHLLYVHSPARSMPAKDFIDENPQARDTLVASNIIRNTEFLVKTEGGIFTINGKEAKPEELTEDTPIVKYWGKTYKAKDIAKNFALINGLGANAPAPQDLMRVLASPDSIYSLRMGLLLKVPMQTVTQSKEYTEATNTAIKTIENEAMGVIIQNSMSAKVDTNVTLRDVTNYYNNLPQKPVKSYTDKGEPIFAGLGESTELIREEIVNSRYQQVFNQLEQELQSQYQLVWKKENLAALLKGISANYEKMQKKAPTQ